MAIAKMNSNLLNNWDISFDTFSRVAGYLRTDYSTFDAYLFLRKELEVDTIEKYREAYRTGKIRHCKPYGKRWLDYTTHKEFNTLQEWVADAGDTMENVLYGVNRVHKNESPKYVEFDRVLTYYGCDVTPKVETTPVTQDITEMINIKMKTRGLTIDNVYILAEGKLVSWTSFMN